ncbi:Methionine import system permease protein MetP [Aedoeadaptatus ivorii]|uniref:Methionine import system permease protein MetP n=1 Tax=Aedoeadaptatus ivorii TaxID=54006 RepID=A0A448V333_9FIRM|nr:methionine ABC transporter permease [Peptoniphilus ivorii]MDQ0508682.1 D-methionine transport system permease protein [Peptoniphilus ivorii]VEJ36191.1 Methionine import system permease protein MetP [Peptoniphilus ivorii]
MEFFSNVIASKGDFVVETGATLYMVLVTSLIAGVLGMITGFVLTLTKEGGLLENKRLYWVLDKFVNIFRSIPFVILLALISPITRAIVHTTIGNTAAIVPLVFGSMPFYARQIENALAEVDPGIIEAAESMGDSPLDIVFGVYMKEGLPAILRASAMTVISLIGLTAMAGAVGAGGLGNLAITRGYNRFQNDIIIVSTVLILILVFITQALFDFWVKKIQH